MPLKYNVFEKVMENGPFAWSKCPIFHNILKSIQNFIEIFLDFFSNVI